MLWTIDFKGQFKTADGQWCFPLTLVDNWSRYLLSCQALRSTATRGARRILERVFQEYGLPDRIRSDNGVPFSAAKAVGRLSALAIWWIHLGIVPELIEPGRPAQNGRHERFHRTLKRETAPPPGATARAPQRRFTAFCHEFNADRPHEALGQRPPAALYVPSPRPYPARLPPLVYTSDTLVRRVDQSGSIRWAPGIRVYVSHVLTGEDIGVRLVADGLGAVYFGPVILGHYTERRGPTSSLMPMTWGRSRPQSDNLNKVSTMSSD